MKELIAKFKEHWIAFSALGGAILIYIYIKRQQANAANAANDTANQAALQSQYLPLIYGSGVGGGSSPSTGSSSVTPLTNPVAPVTVPTDSTVSQGSASSVPNTSQSGVPTNQSTQSPGSNSWPYPYPQNYNPQSVAGNPITAVQPSQNGSTPTPTGPELSFYTATTPFGTTEQLPTLQSYLTRWEAYTETESVAALKNEGVNPYDPTSLSNDVYAIAAQYCAQSGGQGCQNSQSIAQKIAAELGAFFNPSNSTPVNAPANPPGNTAPPATPPSNTNTQGSGTPAGKTGTSPTGPATTRTPTGTSTTPDLTGYRAPMLPGAVLTTVQSGRIGTSTRVIGSFGL